MSEDVSSPDDIARARQLKELEPIHEAWSNWTHARQVRDIRAIIVFPVSMLPQ
jgi:hypothetical protein